MIKVHTKMMQQKYQIMRDYQQLYISKMAILKKVEEMPKHRKLTNTGLQENRKSKEVQKDESSMEKIEESRNSKVKMQNERKIL